jgi:spermidine/putrescine transport system ATP-binding protein
MTVAQNVSFGLEMKGVASKEIRRQVGVALDMVQMNGMEERRPIQLSGGQQQRVALARALINRPKVLLLDEPLGSLDLKLRKAMQVELKALQNQVGITFIYVTHDQEEAMIMSDRIGVMKDGHVLQVDTPMEIYEQPRNRFVADFIGETNFIPGRVKELGQPIVVSLMGGFQVPAGIAEEGILPGDQAVVSIRPEKLHLFALDHVPDGQDRVTARLRGSVIQMIYLGTDTRYVVLLDGGVNLVARMQNVNGTETRFHSGDSVEVRWEANHARVLKE